LTFRFKYSRMSSHTDTILQTTLQCLRASATIYQSTWSNILEDLNFTLIHSFHWHVQNAMIPCRSQELLPFLSVMYFFLPPFSTNYSSILPHFILPSISWSTSQSLLFQNSYIILLGILFSSLYMPKPT